METLPKDCLVRILCVVDTTIPFSLVSKACLAACEAYWLAYHLPSKEANSFWTTNWPRSRVVDFEAFWPKLEAKLKIAARFTGEGETESIQKLFHQHLSNSSRGQKLSKILALEENPNPKISVANFGNLLKWLGPLTGPSPFPVVACPENPPDLLDNLLALSKIPHFFGNLDYGSCHPLFFNSRSHAALLRFGTRVEGTPFAISCQPKSCVYYQVRIFRDPESTIAAPILTCTIEGKTSSAGSIVELWQKVLETHELEVYEKTSVPAALKK